MIGFISAGNGCIYVQSRALYSLALTNRAPKFFAITSKKGGQFLKRIPYPNHALTSSNSLCLYPYILLLGSSSLDEFESHYRSSLRIYDLRKRFSCIHRLGWHHLYSSSCQQRHGEGRHPHLNISLQSTGQHLDLPLQHVPQHFYPPDPRIHGL